MTQDTRHFDAELDELKQRVLTMAGLAEERLREAMRALIARDADLMAAVIRGDDAINRLHLEIDDRCFKLLALNQPMAVDLRIIVAAVKINSDLERIGDLAVNMAQASERYVQHNPVKPLIDIPRMGVMAERMLSEAIGAFVTSDVTAARAVLAQDDELDALKDQIFRELLTYMLGDTRTIEPSIDLILIARHLERVGDHATNIAEDVIFIVEALDVRHHTGGQVV
jgi:phosphate transport system protein